MDEADWDGALEAFRLAEEATDLSLGDFESLLARRATVYFAIGEDALARRDLEWLAAVAPDHELGAAVPPNVREAFSRTRAATRRLTVAIAAEPSRAGATRFRARLGDEPEGLVRDVRIVYRATSSASWSDAHGRDLDVAVDGCEYYAEVIGPGGAVIATDGSSDDPHRSAASAVAVTVAPMPGSDDTLWWAIGGTAGGVVVLAVVIGVAVAVGTPSDQTAFGPPMVRMP